MKSSTIGIGHTLNQLVIPVLEGNLIVQRFVIFLTIAHLKQYGAGNKIRAISSAVSHGPWSYYPENQRHLFWRKLAAFSLITKVLVLTVE